MSFKSDEISISAPAKVNLFLEVLGKRDDGYHDIRSVVVPISLSDDLVLRRTTGEIRVDVVPDAEASLVDLSISGDNLVVRAAALLREEAGVSDGVHVELRKRIPVGGGLGGGSADAAATLVGLNSFWNTGLDLNSLCDMGARLGRDVPALLYNQPILVEGVGDRISPISFDQSPRCAADAGWWLVLLNPGFAVSTPDVYSRCRWALTSERRTYTRMVSAVSERRLDLASESLFNGLQETVFRKYPLIRMMSEALLSAGALGALVSGSGGSVFGVTKDREHAESVRKAACCLLGDCMWSSVVRTLPDGVMVAHGPLEA